MPQNGFDVHADYFRISYQKLKQVMLYSSKMKVKQVKEKSMYAMMHLEVNHHINENKIVKFVNTTYDHMC